MIFKPHKVTHLFSHAVYNTPMNELPNNYWLWDSPMTTQFGTMTSNLLAHIINATDLPPHTQLMANISINEGGLGIQTPHMNAITPYMTTSKRCLQYARDGVWLGYNKARPQFSRDIQLLYADWESPGNRSWSIFRKYLPTLNETSISQPNSHTDYIYKASLNGSREKRKNIALGNLKPMYCLTTLSRPTTSNKSSQQ
jgi:hypothetical protein